jgi:hypothetical protein
MGPIDIAESQNFCIKEIVASLLKPPLVSTFNENNLILMSVNCVIVQNNYFRITMKKRGKITKNLQMIQQHG